MARYKCRYRHSHRPLSPSKVLRKSTWPQVRSEFVAPRRRPPPLTAAAAKKAEKEAAAAAAQAEKEAAAAATQVEKKAHGRCQKAYGGRT